MKYAITGGIGCGKSYVCEILKKRGIDVYDCDSAAKRIMRESTEIQNRIKEAVGEFSKPAISKFLLASKENENIINSIVHPAVAEDFIMSKKEWMECAILFSSGFDKLVDKVICVTAPLEIRIERIMQRDSITRTQALEWINKQMLQDEIVNLSDYEIKNDEKSDLDIQINEILNRFL